MRQTCFVALLLSAILPVFVIAQSPAKTCRTETKYDHETDTTVVQCDLIESVVSPVRLMIRAGASFHGKRPNDDAKFWLGLAAYKGGANNRFSPLFREANTLSLLVDSTWLEVPVQGYGNDFYELNRLMVEQARAEISREDLQKLLEAQSIKGKWGNAEFKLPEAALVSLKHFINRQVFGVQPR